MTSWRSLVLRRAVVFLLLDQFEGAALARVGSVEGAREKLDALGQAFDDGEAVVIHRALDHLGHVVDLAAWVRATKVAPLATSFFIGLTGWSIAPVGSVLDLNPIGEVGEVCFFVRP